MQATKFRNRSVAFPVVNDNDEASARATICALRALTVPRSDIIEFINSVIYVSVQYLFNICIYFPIHATFFLILITLCFDLISSLVLTTVNYY